MKKIVAMALCALLVFGLVACGAPAEQPENSASAGASASAPAATDSAAADDSLQKVKDKGVFVLGLDDSFPPYGYKDTDGVVKGFDIDLATEVCKRLGVELKVQAINWDTKVMELNNGNIDCIWNGFTMSEEMKTQVLFTDPYVKNRQIIVVRADSDINTKADLKDKVVGVQAGSSANEAIDNEADVKATFKELLPIKDNVLALTELKNKSVDAVVLDEAVGMSYVNQEPDVYKVLEEDFGGEEYGIGFRLGDQALMEAVNDTLQEMREDGTFAEIVAKWPDVVGAITE